LGHTRTRVTVLVLGLELLGFVLLGFAVWLAGETSLACQPAGEARLDCTLSERRLLWLLPVRDEKIAGVEAIEVDVADKAWLVARTAAGPRRTLRGSAATTEADAFQLESTRRQGGAPSAVVRSDLGWALLTAAFGFLWLIVISLIMREFLGFHTPWWVSLFRHRRH
jgi:hypothetical protein